MSIDGDTFAKWDDWLSKIHDDVTQLLIERFIYRKTGEIVRANPKVNLPSMFYTFLANGFIGMIGLGIRRQVESRKDSISLRRLLEEIERQPTILTRARLRTLYASRGANPEWAESDFDGIAGPGSVYVDPARIRAQIDALATVGDTVKAFVDRRLAHLDPRGPAGEAPTFDDLNSALDHVEEIVKHLLLVFRGEGWGFLTPVPQYDWTSIFREPWIPKRLEREGDS